jgi:hypothetical protein
MGRSLVFVLSYIRRRQDCIERFVWMAGQEIALQGTSLGPSHVFNWLEGGESMVLSWHPIAEPSKAICKYQCR